MQPDSTRPVVAVNYSRSFGPYGSELVEVTREGVSTLSVSFNHDGRPELGLWQHPIAPERFEELVRCLHASGYHRLKQPDNGFPGYAPVSYGERRMGDEWPSVRSSFPDQPELREVAALVSALMDELRQHPVYVLRGQARCRESTLQTGGALAIDVQLTNAGPQALRVASPINWNRGRGGLQLSFMRSDSGLCAGIDPSATQVQLDEAMPTATLLSLEPGQAFSFAICAPVPVGAGPYELGLSLGLHNDRDTAEQVGGWLQLALAPVSVR